MTRYLPPGTKSTAQAYELLIDKHMSELSGGAWKILLYIARRTWGFGKQSDKISLTQFSRGIKRRNGTALDYGTGLGRKAVIVGLRELQALGLITRRTLGRGTVNVYAIVWPPVSASKKETSVTSTLGSSVNDEPEVVSKGNPQQSVQQTASQETEDDHDCPPTNCRRRDSRAGVSASESVCKQYPELKAALTEYMEGDEPSDRLVVEVMNAARGGTDADEYVTEEAVVACLCHLFRDRGLRPGTKNGPRLWAWFPTVVQDYFERKERRREAANPVGYLEWVDRNDARWQQKFDEMTSVLELPDANL